MPNTELWSRCQHFMPSGGDVFRAFVPGRIELFGKHTDYAGGRSLVCAVDRGFHLLACPHRGAQLRLIDAISGELREFPIGDVPADSSDWSIYPATAARRMALNFPGPHRGAQIIFASDLPAAAGLGSSSALVVATWIALAEINRLSAHPHYTSNITNAHELAEYLACVESGVSYKSLAGDLGVGTIGGSQDHTAILCCQEGTFSQFAYRPVRLERKVPLPSTCTLVVGVSGVTAQKTGAAKDRYNRSVKLAGQVLQIWNDAAGRADSTLAGAVHGAPDAPQRMRQSIEHSTMLLDRFEQFLEESEQIVPAAAEALREADFARLGFLAARSQELAEQRLGNQIEQTKDLARMARSCGAVAASAFGAGFGGSVWAIVPVERADEFLVRWQQAYLLKHPELRPAARFFLTPAGRSASVWKDR
jgi:galactokinase